ncbi:MAG: hypothetical protein AMXMBFR84_23110 [Candidatus Hydrogenedentota bacterium]
MHPFERVPHGFRTPLFLALTFAAILSSVVMARVGAPLNTPEAPLGIVSYEFAWDGANAARMIDSWSAVRESALQSLIIDYGYMVVYSSAIGFACILAAGVWLRTSLIMGIAGRYLAWGQWAAAALDGIENAALLVMFLGTPSTPAAQIAFWCASAKFALIITGLLYALSGLIMRFAGPKAVSAS